MAWATANRAPDVTKYIRNQLHANLRSTRSNEAILVWSLGSAMLEVFQRYPDPDPLVLRGERDIRWATSHGFVAGYSEGSFAPSDVITGGQMAVLLCSYKKKCGDGGSTGEWMYRLPFGDLDQISDWAFEVEAWCNMRYHHWQGWQPL